jgi:hypothetical protein
MPALIWFAILQLVTRYTTKPELNVNVAHFPYALVKEWISGYWTFWPVCLIFAAAMVWTAEFTLLTLYPAGERRATSRRR